MPRVALATSDPPQPLAARDDAALAAALAARGASAEVVPWTAAVDWSAFDLVVVRTTWDYWDRLDEFRAWADRVEAATTLCNPARVLRWNTDKRYLLRLAARGAAVPPTALLPRGAAADLAGLLAARGWTEAVVKKAVTAGARGQLRVRADDARAAQPALEALLAHGDVLVQPFLPDVARRGEVSVVVVDGEPVHAVRKRPRAGDYVAHPSHGAAVEAADLEAFAPAARAVLRAAEAPDLLFARVDLVDAAQGPPLLMELELVEPYLFLAEVPAGAARLAEASLRRLA